MINHQQYWLLEGKMYPLNIHINSTGEENERIS